MAQRTPVKHGETFEQRLNDVAKHLRDWAAALSFGKDRKLLLKRADQAEKASSIDAALILRTAAAEMTDASKVPIILHAADALRRARKFPVGAARNDLRQLARSLRDLHRTDAHANLRSVKSPRDGLRECAVR